MSFFLISGRRTILSAGTIVLSMIVGCSDSGPKRPKAVPVSGKITYKNAPLAGASVGFVSILDNKDVFPGRGVTNDSGEFTLTSYIDPQHEVAGVTPGDFVVTVSKSEKPDRQKVLEQFRSNPVMEFKSLLPEKYADAKQTPLKASVTADGKNRFEFKVEED